MDYESDEKVKSKASHESIPLTENHLDNYSRSWDSILALDAVMKLQTKGRIDTLNSENIVFTSVAKTCSELCSKIYLTESETELMEEEEERLERKVSDIDAKMNDIMRKLFPGKKDAVVHTPNAQEIEHLEAQLEMQLQAYKSAIKSRHGTVFHLQR